MKIKEVDEMTVQQAIEYSLDKLIQQGKQCMLKADCLYGDGLGNHCAIGWLLENDKELMNNESGVNGLCSLSKTARLIPQLIKNNVKIFSVYQRLHDDNLRVGRKGLLGDLQALNIDTSHPNFQKWVDLGK
jgi:hypothetical protein